MSYQPQATPTDSRYIPLTQQPSCCVPTCFQMVMLKYNIPLMPAEEIGYQLGLVVHTDREHLFYNVRTAAAPPPAGYGARIYDPEFEPNRAFERLGIPLSLSQILINEIADAENLISKLIEIEKKNQDALLCFNHGALIDDPEQNWGHVVVFDRIIDSKIRIIDPSPHHPKWRLVDAAKLLSAMQKHGEQRSAGIWLIGKEN